MRATRGSGALRHGPGMYPLPELVGSNYLGFSGGLYPSSNDMPSAHQAAGIAAAASIIPRDAAGASSPTGKIVLLSIGMSNGTQEFCTGSPPGTPCASYSFIGQALLDSAVDQTDLVIVDGAQVAQPAVSWDSSSDTAYDTVATRLTDAGVTPAQVQAVWLKVSNSTPTISLPSASADAYALKTSMGNILRALRARYTNLQMVFASSRIYGGYALSTLNPEPYAYESGFAVKWLVEAQITQVATGNVDAHTGNIDYRDNTAPWVAWGPYLWGKGATPRASDGRTWLPSDFDPNDGTHPMPGAGRKKVADQLLEFFKTSPFTRDWFLA